jgi:hypothetical protein
MAQQLDLFRKPRRPAQPKPRTLHVCDASAPSHNNHCWIRLRCDLCEHATDWVPRRSVTAELKGRVCPKCKGSPINVKPSGGTADKEPS